MIFQTDYLDKGSPALRDFVRLGKIADASTLAAAVSRTPNYYASLATLPGRLEAKRPSIDRVVRELHALNPDGTIPPIHFVVGHFRSSGTVSPAGMLIGAEVWAVSEGVPLDEFSPKARAWVHPLDDVVYNIAHEMVHTQQRWQGKDRLLEVAIVEGTAELIAEMLVPNAPILPMRAWADANTRKVWSRFAAEMDGTDTSEWIANNDRATAEWPAALGYYVGYRIAQSYYAKAADKTRAIQDLLKLDDARAILRASAWPRSG